MRAVLQRVRAGSVSVAGEILAQIGPGLVILLGIGQEDSEVEASWMAHKCATLRIFEDKQGKTNLSIRQVRGEALVVPQFTLYADSRKGRRPSFVQAADPELAEPLVDRFVGLLKEQGVPSSAGQFGAHMVVHIENDGPVTILLEREAETD